MNFSDCKEKRRKRCSAYTSYCALKSFECLCQPRRNTVSVDSEIFQGPAPSVQEQSPGENEKQHPSRFRSVSLLLYPSHLPQKRRRAPLLFFGCVIEQRRFFRGQRRRLRLTIHGGNLLTHARGELRYSTHSPFPPPFLHAQKNNPAASLKSPKGEVGGGESILKTFFLFRVGSRNWDGPRSQKINRSLTHTHSHRKSIHASVVTSHTRFHTKKEVGVEKKNNARCRSVFWGVGKVCEKMNLCVYAFFFLRSANAIFSFS